MQPKNGNAQRAGQGSKGANAVQCAVACVSVTHSLPDVFGPLGLAFAMLITDEGGAINDDEAAAGLLEMGWPLEVKGVTWADGALITRWALCWDYLSECDFDGWLQAFHDGLDEVRLQATGQDRVALERLEWFFESEENRTDAARRAIPTPNEYAAIAARILKKEH